MNIKIIFVMSFSPLYDNHLDAPRPAINWDTSDGNWVGIWGLDWGNQIGNHFLKYYPEAEFEIWQPDTRADKPYHHRFESGVVHRLFPANYKQGKIFSEAMIEGVKREIAGSAHQLILQINGMKDPMSEYILDHFSHRVPVLTQFLGSLSFVHPNLDFRVWRWAQRYMERKALLRFIQEKQRYIAIGEFLPLEAPFRKIMRATENRIFISGIGIAEDYFSDRHDKAPLRSKWGVPQENTVFLSSSRLVPLKQIHQLIQAFGRISTERCTLLISGAGSVDYVNKLKRAIADQDRDIRLLGYLSEAELIECYKLSDVFVDASQNDGGPISGWKAMGLNLKVITTATGNVGRFLKRYDAGLFIPIRDYKSWTRVFEEVVSGRRTIKRVAVPDVFNVKSWEACSRDLMAIYDQIIQDFKAENQQEAIALN